MTTYVMRDGKLVEKDKAAPLPGKHIVSDFTEVFESPIDGSLIHSKGQYERHLRAHGKHVSEPGDVKPRPRATPDDVGRDVKRALQQLGVVG